MTYSWKVVPFGWSFIWLEVVQFVDSSISWDVSFGGYIKGGTDHRPPTKWNNSSNESNFSSFHSVAMLHSVGGTCSIRWGFIRWPMTWCATGRRGSETRWYCRHWPRRDDDHPLQALGDCCDCSFYRLMICWIGNVIGRTSYEISLSLHRASILFFSCLSSTMFLTWTDLICPGRNIVRRLLYLEMAHQRIIGSLRYFKWVWTSSKVMGENDLCTVLLVRFYVWNI